GVHVSLLEEAGEVGLRQVLGVGGRSPAPAAEGVDGRPVAHAQARERLARRSRVRAPGFQDQAPVRGLEPYARLRRDALAASVERTLARMVRQMSRRRVDK